MPPNYGMTRAGILVPILDFARTVGAPVEHLLEATGLPPGVVADPEAMVPTVSTVRLLQVVARTQGIDGLGALAGAHASIERLGIFGRLIGHTMTLRETLAATVRNHATFSSNGRMWLLVRPDGDVELCQAFTNGFDDTWRDASHYILMLMLHVIRLGAGPTWRPTEVRLQTAESPGLRDLEALSAAHLSFSQPDTAIRIPAVLLHNPVSPPDSGDVAPDDAASWRAFAPANDVIGSITQVIETLSWDSYPSIRATACALGMSVRTLQRHLGAAGVTHEALVGRTRLATAATLLHETDAKILEIALDLGYSDHAHFTRAFRRWTGCSPQEYRRRSRGERPAPAA